MNRKKEVEEKIAGITKVIEAAAKSDIEIQSEDLANVMLSAILQVLADISVTLAMMVETKGSEGKE